MKYIWLSLFLFCNFFIAGEVVGEINEFIRSGLDGHPSIEVVYRIVGFSILTLVLWQRRNFGEK